MTNEELHKELIQFGRLEALLEVLDMIENTAPPKQNKEISHMNIQQELTRQVHINLIRELKELIKPPTDFKWLKTVFDSMGIDYSEKETKLLLANVALNFKDEEFKSLQETESPYRYFPRK